MKLISYTHIIIIVQTAVLVFQQQQQQQQQKNHEKKKKKPIKYYIVSLLVLTEVIDFKIIFLMVKMTQWGFFFPNLDLWNPHALDTML